MAPKAQAPRPLTWPIIIFGVVSALALALLGLPSVVALWLAAIVLSIQFPPATLTGTKVAGIPTPAHAGEEAMVRRYREINARKLRLFGQDLVVPGWPIQWSWVSAVLVGLTAAFALPVRHEAFAVINGLTAALLVSGYAGAKRLHAADNDPSPGVRVATLFHAAARSPRDALMAALAGVVSVVLGVGTLGSAFILLAQVSVMLQRTGLHFPTMQWPRLGLLFIGATSAWLVLTALLWPSLRKVALADWLARAEGRTEWKPRWELLKAPGTTLLDRKIIGPATIDKFRAEPGKQIQAYIAMGPQLPAVAGDGVTYTVLNAPTEDGSGLSSTEFEIVAWPAGETVDFSSTNPSTEVVELATKVALAQFCDANAFPRVGLQEVMPLPTAPARDPRRRPVRRPEGDEGAPSRSRRPERTEDDPDARDRPRRVAPARTEDDPVEPPRPFDPHDPNGVAAAVFAPSDEPPGIHAIFTTPLEDPFVEVPEPKERRPVLAPLARQLATSARTVVQRARPVIDGIQGAGRKVGAFLKEAVLGSSSAEDFTPAPTVYRVRVSGLGYNVLRSAEGSLAGAFGAPALVDDARLSQQQPGAIYVGSVNDESLRFDPETEVTQTIFHNLRQEAWWTPKWAQSIKMSYKPPDWHPAGHLELKLADGTPVIRDGFLVKDGDHPDKFWGAEPGVRSALTSAAFTSITSWAVQGARPGERHAATVAVWWSPQGGNIPTTPELVVPPESGARRGRPDPHHLAAEGAVLGWLTNQAFESQRLARPELVQVRPLTTSRSRRHIWRIRVRFYGGVTLADVRKRAGAIQSSLGADWLRVVPAQDGCEFVVGAFPSEVELVDPQDTAGYLESLDLEQAFLDANIAGKNGTTPTLIEQAVMPNNENVRVLDYQLPIGVDLTKIRANLEKLRTNTNMEFLTIGPGKHGAASMRVLMAREDPMPDRVAYDWEWDYSSGDIKFGVGIDGEPVVYPYKSEPHALLVGLSGSGKSAAAANLVTGLLLHGAHVAVVDAQKKCADFRYASQWTMAQATTVTDAVAVMEAAYAEVKRRAEINGEHGVGSVRDLPEELRVKPWFVVLDEFVGLISVGSKPSNRPEADPEMEAARLLATAEYEAKRRIVYLADRIGAEARSADVHVLLLTQKLTAASIPPEANTLKVNLARILLGKSTYGDKQASLREPDEAPDMGEVVPKGRGIWEGTETRPMAVQFCYASPEEYEKGLTEAGVVPAPTLDLTSYKPIPASEREKFAVIGGDSTPASPIEVAEPAEEDLVVPIIDSDLDGDDDAEELDMDFALDDLDFNIDGDDDAEAAEQTTDAAMSVPSGVEEPVADIVEPVSAAPESVVLDDDSGRFDLEQMAPPAVETRIDPSEASAEPGQTGASDEELIDDPRRRPPVNPSGAVEIRSEWSETFGGPIRKPSAPKRAERPSAPRGGSMRDILAKTRELPEETVEASPQPSPSPDEPFGPVQSPIHRDGPF